MSRDAMQDDRMRAWAALSPDQRTYLNDCYTDRRHMERAEVDDLSTSALVRRLQSAKLARCQCAELAGLLAEAGARIEELNKQLDAERQLIKQHEKYADTVRSALKPVATK